MRRAFMVSGMATVCLVALLAMGCDQASPPPPTRPPVPTPTPTPTPIPVAELHRLLLEDRELNSSRSRLRIEREEVHRFIGEVTDIQDLAVQFHIEKRAFRGDIYVECSFTSDEKFWELNEGDRATVQGHLTEIGDVTKFERCELVSVE